MIHYDIPEPKLSPNFTIDDIHKIREYHYKMLKDATIEERTRFYHEGAQEVEAKIEKLRQERREREARSGHSPSL